MTVDVRHELLPPDYGAFTLTYTHPPGLGPGCIRHTVEFSRIVASAAICIQSTGRNRLVELSSIGIPSR